jgi:hypothetical protein
MMRRAQREQFAEFAKLRRGIPTLAMRRNSKTTHAWWGDGLLEDCREFSDAIDNDIMRKELHEAFERHKKQCSRRTSMHYGGVHGGLSYGPHALADEVVYIVNKHFIRALEIVAAKVESHRS